MENADMKTQFHETVNKGENPTKAANKVNLHIGATLGKCTREEAVRHAQMLNLIDEIEKDKKETAGEEQLQKVRAAHAAHFAEKDQIGFEVKDGIVRQKDAEAIVITKAPYF